jgi:hypothetical protein
VNDATIELAPESYEKHPVHGSERIWSETNCYVDLWIELLHSLGLDPLACAAFTLSADFDGDQWSFLKFPPADLRAVYGITVSEMNVWRPVLDHVVDQLSRGRLLTVEVDSYFLPDTAGVSFGLEHAKSTIVPWSVNRDRMEMTYFHNAGFFEVSGENFRGVFRIDEFDAPTALPPYVEVINLDDAHLRRDVLATAVGLTRTHLDQRAHSNPIRRMRAKVEADHDWLLSQSIETFHLYAFGLFRQCGAGAELAGSYVDWLNVNDGGGLEGVGDEFRSVASSAKSLQFALARLARGRDADLDGPFRSMEASWDAATGRLIDRYGC